MQHPLIDRLKLQAHPEGGYYRETYRSTQTVHSTGRQRQALTVIYYLLLAGQHSAWHRVLSDETWHYYEGDGLELLSMTPDGHSVNTILLNNMNRHAVIEAGHWQAARPLGAYCLVGCCVSPGFEFSDFLLLRDHPRQQYVDEQWHSLL